MLKHSWTDEKYLFDCQLSTHWTLHGMWSKGHSGARPVVGLDDLRGSFPAKTVL